MAETDASAAEIAEGGWLLVELEASGAPEGLGAGSSAHHVWATPCEWIVFLVVG